MHHHDDEIATLEHHGVKPTAVRLLVWRGISGKSEAFTLRDLEMSMPDMDRSSIFRALRLFTEHQLLHEIDDGLGHTKYCLCRCEGRNHLNHVHFSCVECGRTFCIEDQTIPVVKLPADFQVQEIEYVVKGICPSCQGKKH